ncbi:MAG: hypothetical protein WCC87_17245 [Candidatus Korobacteraceae bacterium]
MFALLFASGMALGQAQQQSTTLVLNGKSGQVPVIQTGGRTYVDVEALARLANGSLSFRDNGIALTIPSSPASASAAAEAPTAADNSSLSRSFMKAGIEEMALLREWGAAVGYAIQNGYPIQEAWAANYQQKAAQGAKMAEIAATTGGDKDALQLLTNEYHGVRDWSNQLVAASTSMNTAKYSMSPGALRNDPQSQKLITCWQFLGSMLSSGSFQDDSSCH